MATEGCDVASPCCPGLKCAKGACTADCSLNTEPCSATASCCPGFVCGANGTCAPPCTTQGKSCTDSAVCCTGLTCANGTCACLAEGDVCAAGGEPCCSGLSCDGTAHCRAACTLPVGACQPFGAACAADGGGCCGAVTCQGGLCNDPALVATCSLEGGPCAGLTDCCGKAAFGSQLDCVPASDGGSVCHLGKAGDLCDTLRHCVPGINCVYPPVPDSGVPDAGVDDGGSTDAGADAGTDGGSTVIDAGTPVGVCTLAKTNLTCTLFSGSCTPGDSCNPNSSTNQGYDPCYLKVNASNQLGYRPQFLACRSGFCAQPIDGDPCTGTCTQTVGDPRRTSCLTLYDTSKQCMPACANDSDCRGSSFYDGNLNNAQRVANFCVNYGTASGCQPLLCFAEGQTGPLGDTGALYKPCASHPDTLCLPRYVSGDSNIEGFCTPVRPDAGTTVGQTCDPRAGREATTANCGPDAICLGGRCAAICDASQLGRKGTPACSKDLTCISPQGLDLISDYQFGGCGDPCDPFADLAHSGCVNYCGGPPVRCTWIIGDEKPSAPRGYCAASIKPPIKVGKICKSGGAVEQCETGAYCLLSSDGVTRVCTRLCDPSEDAGTPDMCPNNLTCTAFAGFTRSGYCH